MIIGKPPTDGLAIALGNPTTPIPAFKRPAALTITNPVSIPGFAPPPPGAAMPKTPVTVRTHTSTELHAAVLAGDADAVRALTAPPAPLLDAVDENGYSPLHSVCAKREDAATSACLALLLAAHPKVDLADAEGYTACHWGAACNNGAAITALAAAGANLASRCPAGDTPLHRACRFGCARSISALLSDGVRAPAFARNAARLTPLDVAGVNDSGQPSRHLRNSARAAFFAACPAARTLVLYHPDCEAHVTRPGHQESSRRVSELLRRVRAAPKSAGKHFDAGEITLSSDFPAATLDVVRLAHTTEYVAFVGSLAEQVELAGSSPLPFTPRLQSALHAGSGGAAAKAAAKALDAPSDTSFSAGTLQARALPLSVRG